MAALNLTLVGEDGSSISVEIGEDKTVRDGDMTWAEMGIGAGGILCGKRRVATSKEGPILRYCRTVEGR